MTAILSALAGILLNSLNCGNRGSTRAICMVYSFPMYPARHGYSPIRQGYELTTGSVLLMKTARFDSLSFSSLLPARYRRFVSTCNHVCIDLEAIVCYLASEKIRAFVCMYLLSSATRCEHTTRVVLHRDSLFHVRHHMNAESKLVSSHRLSGGWASSRREALSCRLIPGSPTLLR